MTAQGSTPPARGPASAPLRRPQLTGGGRFVASPQPHHTPTALDAVLGAVATAQAVVALDDAWLAALATSPTGVFVVDAAGRPRFANPRAAELLGLAVAAPPTGGAAVEPLSAAVASALDALPAIRQPIVEALQGGPPRVAEAEVAVAGATRLVQVHAAAVRDGAGAVRLAVASLLDLTDRRERQAATAALAELQHRLGGRSEGHLARLAESERRYRLLFERNLAGVCRSTLGGRILDVNEAMVRLFGYDSVEEMLLLHARDLYPDGDRAKHLRHLRRKRALSSVELRLRRKDGSFFWGLLSSTLIADPEAGEPVIEATVLDITARRESEELSAWRATHDPLTGLPNRLLFADRLAQALAGARRSGTTLGVGFVDLDGFKGINDRCGHEVGDRLLVAMAERLAGALRESDTLARWGGDELVLLLPGLRPVDAAEMVGKLMALAAAPFPCLPDGEHATASLGIALFPDDGGDAQTLLRRADQAMYRVKHRHHREAGG